MDAPIIAPNLPQAALTPFNVELQLDENDMEELMKVVVPGP